MIDGSEKRNRQLAFELLNFRIRMFVKSAIKENSKIIAAFISHSMSWEKTFQYVF